MRLTRTTIQHNRIVEKRRGGATGAAHQTLDTPPDARYPSADALPEVSVALDMMAEKSEARTVEEEQDPEFRRRRYPAGMVLGGFALMLTVAFAWWILRDALAPTPVVPSVEIGQVESIAIQPGVYERVLASVGSSIRRRGVLLVKTAPSGTIMLEDGTQGEDSLEATVRVGRHRIRFSHPIYGEHEVEVRVGPGQRKEVINYYEGYLRVRVQDENGLPLPAELYLNDQPTGHQTPLDEPFPLNPGFYTLDVVLEGYHGTSSVVAVLPPAIDSIITAPPIELLEFVLQKNE